MAYVLVAHADVDIRDAMVTLFREVGHVVVGSPDGDMALSILQLSAHPMVALLDERLSSCSGLALLGLVANDPPGGSLARHRYILMSTMPDYIDATGRGLLALLDAQILSEPFDLDSLLEMVDEAAATECRIRQNHPLPFCLRATNGKPCETGRF